MTRMLLVAAASSVSLALSISSALAAGPYDGTWEIQAPKADIFSNYPMGCDPVRVQIQVRDGSISGAIKMAAFGYSHVENASDGTSATGSVEPDGKFVGRWNNIDLIGQLNGNAGEVHWKADCGPRTASVTRVSQ